MMHLLPKCAESLHVKLQWKPIELSEEDMLFIGMQLDARRIAQIFDIPNQELGVIYDGGRKDERATR